MEDAQEMHVECLSKHAVFFQSHCFNMSLNFEPHSVVKIPPGSSACVFRLETFTRAIQHNLRLETYDYDNVYNMSSMCTVRISFVKGWGASYKRTKITQCPCWVDITLNGPLHMLDKVLRYLHQPLACLSSGSGGKNSPVHQPAASLKHRANVAADLSKLAIASLESLQQMSAQFEQQPQNSSSNFTSSSLTSAASGRNLCECCLSEKCNKMQSSALPDSLSGKLMKGDECKFVDDNDLEIMLMS